MAASNGIQGRTRSKVRERASVETYVESSADACVETAAETYDRLAALFSYPTEDYLERLRAARKTLSTSHPEADTRMARFEAHLAESGQSAIEELFTRSFDLNPECCPEIGWHLFGERYERGSFMVWMRDRLRRCELQETHELPDHLVHVLGVLARMEKDERGRFATEAVLPAMDRMLDGLKDKENPYEGLLRATREVLVADFGPPKWVVTNSAPSANPPAAVLDQEGGK